MHHQDNGDAKVSGTVVDGTIEGDRRLNKVIKKKTGVRRQLLKLGLAKGIIGGQIVDVGNPFKITWVTGDYVNTTWTTKLG